MLAGSFGVTAFCGKKLCWVCVRFSGRGQKRLMIREVSSGVIVATGARRSRATAAVEEQPAGQLLAPLGAIASGAKACNPKECAQAP